MRSRPQESGERAGGSLETKQSSVPGPAHMLSTAILPPALRGSIITLSTAEDTPWSALSLTQLSGLWSRDTRLLSSARAGQCRTDGSLSPLRFYWSD